MPTVETERESPLRRLVTLVASHGMDTERAAVIAAYLADRCAGLSIATLHSSSTASLHLDAFLVERLQLSRAQITAWLTLMRGSRPIRRRSGQIVGGCPGFIETAVGSDTAESIPRFTRLARIAAGSLAPKPRPARSGCTRRACS